MIGMFEVLSIAFMIGFTGAIIGEAYFILLNKRALNWFKRLAFQKVKNLALREVLVECDICFSGQCALWLSIAFNVFHGLTLLSVPIVILSLSFSLIIAVLLGKKLNA